MQEDNIWFTIVKTTTTLTKCMFSEKNIYL